MVVNFALPLVTILVHVRICVDSVTVLTFESLVGTVVLPRGIIIRMIE